MTAQLLHLLRQPRKIPLRIVHPLPLLAQLLVLLRHQLQRHKVVMLPSHREILQHLSQGLKLLLVHKSLQAQAFPAQLLALLLPQLQLRHRVKIQQHHKLALLHFLRVLRA